MDGADFDFIEALYLSTRVEEIALSNWSPEQRRMFLTQQHRAQHRHYRTYYPSAEWLIVERYNAPIGRLCLDEWKDQIRIVDISLVTSSRGQGIGEALLRDTALCAAALGKGLSIHVEKTNPARRLYGRLGFNVVEDKGIYELMEWGLRAAQEAASPLTTEKLLRS